MIVPGGYMWATVWTAAAISIGAGVVSLIGGYSIYNNPERTGEWGIAILVASVVGVIRMSGFLIGPILGIIGGILALVRKSRKEDRPRKRKEKKRKSLTLLVSILGSCYGLGNVTMLFPFPSLSMLTVP